jgi:hypothetical protein
MLAMSAVNAAHCTKCRKINNTPEFKHCESCREIRRRANAKYDKTAKSKVVNKRWNSKANPKNNYARTIQRRKVLGNALQGIELFNRSIGEELISPAGCVQL